MDDSPKGREIETLYGDSSTIYDRGVQVTQLGEQMTTAADLLEKLKDGATGQKGLAVDKLKDKVGDCYEDLHKAGERYKPTGPALKAYATSLKDVQPLIASNVSECETLWHTYETKRGAADDLKPPLFPVSTPEPKPGEKTPQEKFDDASGVADDAYEAWKEEAESFDRNYDTWEDAFDKAAHDIGKATHGNISDSFWDDLDGFVAAALTVLKWVGLALTILAIIIGGPILAALALVAAIATLALTAYSFARGNSSGWDLAFAVIGVIPFGKLSLLKNTKLGVFKNALGFSAKYTDDAGNFAKEAGAFSKAWGETKYVFGAMGRSRGFNSELPFAQRWGRTFKDGFDAWTVPNGRSFADIGARMFTGKEVSYWSKDNSPVDIMGQIWSTQYKRVKTLYTWLS